MLTQKDLIKKILKEEVRKKYTKYTTNMLGIIIRHFEKLLGESTQVTIPNEENYGTYTRQWCKNDKIIIQTSFYFEEDDGSGRYSNGILTLQEEDIDFLQKILMVRKESIINVIVEWFDEKYVTEFGNSVGHPYFEIDETYVTTKNSPCYKLNIDYPSKDEMVNFIISNTGYRSPEDIGFNNEEELKTVYRRIYNLNNKSK